MVISKNEQKISQLILFRKNMGVKTPKDKVVFFWGKDLKNMQNIENFKREKFVEDKINIVKENINSILFFDWVKFVGITGSVAAGTAKEEDDIDVFIIVKNDRMWLYRAFLTMKLGKKSLRRVWGKPFKDKIDTNFICEERGLWFNTESIFVLHELLFMIPVYNSKYYEKILGVNYKLLNNFCIERKKVSLNNKRSFLLGSLNELAFLIQYIYMVVKKHKPSFKRLRRNNRKGRIAFFPEGFRKEKEREYKKIRSKSKQV